MDVRNPLHNKMELMLYRDHQGNLHLKCLKTCKMYSCSKTPYFYIQFYIGMPLSQKMIGLLAACRLTNWSLKCNSYPLSRSKLCFSNKFHYSKLESLRNFNYHLHTKTNLCQNHMINTLGDTMYYIKGSFLIGLHCKYLINTIVS